MIVLNKNHRSAVGAIHLILASVVLTSLCGCGSSDPGPTRFHVSGEATYDKQPIPYGEITFEPDGEANNTGPATSATIENGVYSTKSGKGIVGGAMVVRIIGYDGKAPAGGGTQVHGASLFKTYTEKVTLPKEETTKAFNVPKKK